MDTAAPDLDLSSVFFSICATGYKVWRTQLKPPDILAIGIRTTAENSPRHRMGVWGTTVLEFSTAQKSNHLSGKTWNNRTR